MKERDISKLFSDLGRRGGKASAKALTKEQRVAKAKKAVAARERKRGK